MSFTAICSIWVQRSAISGSSKKTLLQTNKVVSPTRQTAIYVMCPTDHDTNKVICPNKYSGWNKLKAPEVQKDSALRSLPSPWRYVYISAAMGIFSREHFQKTWFISICSKNVRKICPEAVCSLIKSTNYVITWSRFVLGYVGLSLLWMEKW
jgi:hypothetical protein